MKIETVSRRIFRVTLIQAISAGLWLFCAVARAAEPDVGRNEKVLPPAATTAVDFAKSIAPLLRKHCLECHGAGKQESGLRLDSRARAIEGGYSGAVIQPGKSDQSRLIQLVGGVADDEVVMPPEGPRLTAEEIGLLRAWIDQGAVWPDAERISGRAAAGASASGHWAFQPPQWPDLPTVKQAGTIHNAIDRFILARLETEGLTPSPAADRPTLLRRLSLDLIGLPPTPAEVVDFLEDAGPDAYERQVDRLLASPHYGEKWARPWLDLCHYADTDGYLTDQQRPVAWRYRQWLIEALNRDLPFDQFTIDQLAGDLPPEATSEELLATGFLRNTLSNREGGADLEQYRVEQIVDRTMLVGTAWLGLTVGCARCHDHKYDPISQKEFYQLYAYFDAADEVNIDAPLPGEEAPYVAALPAYLAQRAELLRPVEKEIAELQTRWEAKLLAAVASPGKEPGWDRQWEVLGLVWGGRLGEGQLEGTQIVLLEPAKRSRAQHDRLLAYFLKNGQVVDPRRFADLKLAELAQQLDQLESTLPKPTRAPTMRETQNPRPTYLHVRGDFRSRGIEVRPATLSILPSLEASARPNRMALARWLVSPENPLPARVTANRFWQEFFGRGLVATSGDFGTQGEPPTHPELLDWLALEFRRRGGSMKSLQRLIVTSAAYRRSSVARPESQSRDPSNALLARQASLRLSSEQIRDSALGASGLLNPATGGPSVFPPQSESVAKEGFDNSWIVSQGPDRYRRGLYTFIQRLSPFAQNVTFDAPATSGICTRRERSNTPLQALTLLNDPVFFEAAQALAARVLREAPGGVAERIDHAFQLCLARRPTSDETARLSAYYQEQLAILRQEPQAAGALFRGYVEGVDPSEGAAWSCLASVLLNLHEFITRN
ncbi:MAG TPA: PSD1 and planctomycete cytochrome C domain-containing protein [Pirellulales bacterium]|nr:PSD1 and planctomycete cytochrome C domain-containing protein [Pirellulales bacterium]